MSRLEEKQISKETLQAFLDNALISPVLTAHPTEVQRKSILDCQLIISQLLSERDRVDMTPDELEMAFWKGMKRFYNPRVIFRRFFPPEMEAIPGLLYHIYFYWKIRKGIHPFDSVY